MVFGRGLCSLRLDGDDLGSVDGGESAGKVSGKVGNYGWLDRRRYILTVLEEQIEAARLESQSRTGRGRDNKSRLEWAKNLLRLLEMYDAQLETIKRHIHGNTTPGAGEEPGQQANGLIEFERRFQNAVQNPWGPESLKLKCVDCGKLSEEVSECQVPGETELLGKKFQDSVWLNLCSNCYEKRTKTSDSP
jgi:hypothetical protein